MSLNLSFTTRSVITHQNSRFVHARGKASLPGDKTTEILPRPAGSLYPGKGWWRRYPDPNVSATTGQIQVVPVSNLIE